jgi:DNA polymerase
MGALEQGLTEEELPGLVTSWRAANPNIVRFWYAVDKAALEAVEENTTTRTHGIIFQCKSKMLFITLPNGRRLAYVRPQIGENRFGGECVEYMGVSDTKTWGKIQSYGAKFVENITQAISRDLLANAIHTLRNCEIVAHIHDEVVLEADPGLSLEAICRQMVELPPWAEGLELRADGFVCDFYQKD